MNFENIITNSDIILTEGALVERLKSEFRLTMDASINHAGIMPEINEAIGLAKAMAETQLPYVISFMIRKDGRLLDGTLLFEAIEIIDKQVHPAPVFIWRIAFILPTS
ncbi:MAG: hypothetical protein HC831_23905 [Chloroflexia bacterium]|nr:hypothetical protein [Chloroflexia bacterium]